MSSSLPENTVLVVTTDDDLQQIIEACGAADAYPVMVVPHLEDALTTIKRSIPRVILVDLRYTGLATIERLAMHLASAPSAVTVLAGVAREDPALLDELYAVGADDYLTLPPHPPTVCRRLRHHLLHIDVRNEAQFVINTLDEYLSTTTELVQYFDDEGSFQYANEASVRQLGYSPRQLDGRRIFDLVAREYRADFRQRFARLVTGEEARCAFETVLRHRDGQAVYLAGTLSRHPDGVRAIFHDVTAYKKAEALLRESTAALERRNSELDAYSHTLAHDIRTPIQSILNYAYLLRKYFREQVPEKATHYLDRIREQGEHMSQMVDQLLLLARTPDLRDSLTTVYTEKVLKDVLNRFEHEIQARHVTIEIEAPLPNALGHEQWVTEVFANLVSNGLKYMGDSNPTPVIRIRGRQKEGMAHYEVIDNGIGMDPDAQTGLFEGKISHNGRKARRGLGLSIVHRIVMELGGTVGVESTPGVGSTFWFTLPAAVIQSEDFEANV